MDGESHCLEMVLLAPNSELIFKKIKKIVIKEEIIFFGINKTRLLID